MVTGQPFYIYRTRTDVAVPPDELAMVYDEDHALSLLGYYKAEGERKHLRDSSGALIPWNSVSRLFLSREKFPVSGRAA
jgi:hypothetical protein